MIKNAGKIFEADVKSSCKKDGLFVHRIRDNAMSYTESESVFTKDNPYDFLIYKYPLLLAVELKHTKYPSIGIQTSKEENDKKMIKFHQIEQLQLASEHDGVKAGFILSFSNEKTNYETTFYIDINHFLNFLFESKKKSINLMNIIEYGGIKIEQRLLRTHYYYNIKDLFDKI